MWTIFKVFLEFFTILLCFIFCFFFFFGHEARGILVPWRGMERAPPALESKVLSPGPPGKSQEYWYCSWISESVGQHFWSSICCWLWVRLVTLLILPEFSHLFGHQLAGGWSKMACPGPLGCCSCGFSDSMRPAQSCSTGGHRVPRGSGRLQGPLEV